METDATLGVCKTIATFYKVTMINIDSYKEVCSISYALYHNDEQKHDDPLQAETIDVDAN